MAKPNDPSAFYGKGYDNVDDAAAAALWMLSNQPRVKDQEYMGMLVQNPSDGKYYRTDFQTEGKRDTSSWRGYPGGKVAAIVHSHPTKLPNDRYSNNNFSLTDINNAGSMKVPNYIAAQQDNGPSVERKYVPGESQLTYDKSARVSAGDGVLGEIPIDEMKAMWARKIMQNQLMPLDYKKKILAHLIPGYDGSTQ